jgi:hypothetical protein
MGSASDGNGMSWIVLFVVFGEEASLEKEIKVAFMIVICGSSLNLKALSHRVTSHFNTLKCQNTTSFIRSLFECE